MSSTSEETRTSDDLLAERRLRSFELALETTRRRLVEANEEVARLQSRIASLEAELEAAVGAREGEPERLRVDLEIQRARGRAVEQALWDERDRRRDLERELELSRAPWSATAERELAEAQQRARELEGELEIVRRHSAEFEQAIRVAVDEAWQWLGEIGARLESALREQQLRDLRGLGSGAAGGGGGVTPRAAVGGGSAVPGWVMGGSSTPSRPAVDASPGEPVRGDRLDEAFARLREGPAEPASDPAAAGDQVGAGGPVDAAGVGDRVAAGDPVGAGESVGAGGSAGAGDDERAVVKRPSFLRRLFGRRT